MAKDRTSRENPAQNREEPDLQEELDDEPNPILPEDYGTLSAPDPLDDYDTWDETELHQRAQERGIEGYATMSRGALIEALRGG